jgi:hypothetical protein
VNETRATDARRLSQVEQPLGPMMRFNPMGPEGGGVSRYRPLWMPLAEVIVYIAELITGGDLAAAREEFLTATRERALDVYAKRSLFAKDRILIPREDWWNCQYLELPDSMASGFFFGPHERWYDLEIRRSEVEALWPRPLEPSDGAPTLLSPGPKGGERKAAATTSFRSDRIQHASSACSNRRQRRSSAYLGICPRFIERWPSVRGSTLRSGAQDEGRLTRLPHRHAGQGSS